MSSERDAGAPGTPLPAHVPVQITADVVRAGSVSRRFRAGDSRSLLGAYLTLIRGLRDQRRARTIELRRTDIEVLAAHLGVPGAVVVEQLADLMGATRSQRLSMVTLFGAGALVIGLAGSAAAAGPGSGDPVTVPTVAPIATTPATPAPQVATTAPSTTVPAAPTTPAPTTTVAPAVTTTVAPPEILDPPDTVADDDGPAAPSGGIPAEAPAPTTPAPDDTVVTDIGTPPIPPTTPAPDDTVVTDIGTPPIPPTTAPPATTAPPDSAPATTSPPDDTVVTDIGTPPVPPTTDALVG